MKTLYDLSDARDYFRGLKRSGGGIGLVPTMGALHKGHLSLVERAVAECDAVAVSLFVNPSQFDDQGDLKRYPRDFERDRGMLEDAGVDVLFHPRAEDVYPLGYRYRMMETSESRILEGAVRGGHFEGVLTVVLKLLNVVGASRAYFGEKDYQQFVLIRDMVETLFLDTRIVGCPVVREEDGLAMSSRNVLLSWRERELAPGFYRVLAGDGTPGEKEALLVEAGFEVDYVDERWGRLLGAVRLGNVRLIDNVPS